MILDPKNLNPQQMEAVTHKNGPLLIVAGAGSGKTKVLTKRVAWLMSQGVDARNIVALTFTNKAAQEMKERVAGLLVKEVSESGKNYPGRLPLIGTFHYFCIRIIRENIASSGLKKDFTIYDEDDSRSLIKKTIKKMQLADTQFPVGKIKELISFSKNEMKSPSVAKKEADDYFKEKLAEIFGAYQQSLKENNALDFDDILLLPLKMFLEKPELLEKYQNLYQYILVDEYQDTNIPQYQLIKLLAARHKNICVVGDVDQAIYGWRGADFRNILHFEKDYPEAKVVVLEENYRSTQNILNAANKIISGNTERKEKNLWTKNAAGASIKIVSVPNDRAEAEYAVSEVVRLMREENFSLRDFVFLYRTNAQSRVIEEMCLRHNIGYKIVGGLRFYDRKEVKDILAYLRYILNEDDTVSLERIINVPNRGFGKPEEGVIKNIAQKNISSLPPKKQRSAAEFLELIESFRKSAENGGLVELVMLVIKKTGYEAYIKDGTEEGERRLENIMELVNVASEISKTGLAGLAEFLESVALVQESDSFEEKKDVVHLMTLHSVKGLEFPVVFVFGMEEGIFPHSRSLVSKQSAEEERRLCYVGITRAKKHLYLLFAGQRRYFGSIVVNPPSRYISEIPEGLAEFVFYKMSEPNFIDDDLLMPDDDDDDTIFM
jgi:DNA helicase-2/ATP-dependent DNA helicase PcrA